MLVFNGFLLRNFGFQLPLNVPALHAGWGLIINFFLLLLFFGKHKTVFYFSSLPNLLVACVSKSAVCPALPRDTKI